MKNLNLDNVKAADEGKRVVAGGYVAGITAVEDVPSKEYLKVEMDIAEGEFKLYYSELYKSRGFWGLSTIRSYKQNALPFFKAFTTAVEESNPGYKFDNDENKLRGKIVGIILQEEEYKKNDGSIGTRLVVARFTSVDNIRKGDFKVPEKKLLKADDTSSAIINALVNDEPLPWNM